MAGPENQDEYPASEFGGKPLKNMGGIQPAMPLVGVTDAALGFFTEGEVPDRSVGDQLQSLYRTGDELGTVPDDEVFVGTQKDFPIRDIT